MNSVAYIGDKAPFRKMTCSPKTVRDHFVFETVAFEQYGDKVARITFCYGDGDKTKLMTYSRSKANAIVFAMQKHDRFSKELIEIYGEDEC